VQALAALATRRAIPAVVVCPAFLKTNWAREAATWLPGARVHVVGPGAPPVAGAHVTIINYDILSKHLNDLIALHAGADDVAVSADVAAGAHVGAHVTPCALRALVLDESQYIKNPETQRTGAALHLSQFARFHGALVVLLSGTPVLNRPVELLPQLEALGVDDVATLGGDAAYFRNRYCDPKQVSVMMHGRRRVVWDYSGAANVEELHGKLCRGGWFLRRLKAEVLKELPPKARVTVLAELPPAARRSYDSALKALKTARAERRAKPPSAAAAAAAKEAKEEGAPPLSRAAEEQGDMARLRAHLAILKAPLVYEWIEAFLASAAPERKLIVFAHHIALVDAVAARFGGLRIRGGDAPAARQAAVDAFQTSAAPSARVIAASIAAGGVGLTLTAASDVLFAELAWAPTVNAQAEDRAHRIGQKSPVTIHTLVALNTLDAVVAAVLERKEGVVGGAVDGVEAGELAARARGTGVERDAAAAGAAAGGGFGGFAAGVEASVAAEVARTLLGDA
jgi:SWI/SNF-related matrix-associated actin-dependent regulator 1 of chromatin subfamily A